MIFVLKSFAIAEITLGTLKVIELFDKSHLPLSYSL